MTKENNKITIELDIKETEILLGAIAHVVPSDKSHEMILVMLFNRIKGKYEEFLSGR